MSAVSIPSRPTARNATSTSPHPAPERWLSTSARNSRESPRAVRSIQKIIQVTNPAATIESRPPMSSCASKERP
jgi:hypothetical protein